MDFDRAKDEINERLDPIEVIGQYVRLQKAGGRFKGLCPFHEEKTPSFSVDPASGLWYCFGCSQGGDLFSFVMNREGLEFPEALRMLARRAGVTIESDPLATERRQRRELLERANEIACRRFISHLFDAPEAEHARDYLRQREFSRRAIDRFKIGYALDRWDDLLDVLAEKGINAEIAEEAGLVKRSDRGGHYDTFRNRIMFPIADVSGRVVGFGGRSLDTENPAKYLNSPETPLFRKRRTVYALEVARQAISAEGRALIVEGYTDVISLHQAGIGNTVAGLGTALTARQLQLLGRYADEVVLVYDSDTAGARAALQNLDVVEQAEISASLIVLPENTDPDEFVMEHGADAFGELLDRRISPIEYQLRMIFEQHEDRGPEGAADAARKAVDILLKIEDWPRRDEFVGRAADLWGRGDPGRTDSMARVLKMQLQQRLLEDGGRRRQRRSSPDSTHITELLSKPPAGKLTAETEMLVRALQDPEIARGVVERLEPNDMLTEADATILEALARQLAEQDAIDARALVEGLPEVGGVRRRGVELTVADVPCSQDDEACKAEIEATIRLLRAHRRSGGAAATAPADTVADHDAEIEVEDFEELRREVSEGIDSGKLSPDHPKVQQYKAIVRSLRGSNGRGYFGDTQIRGDASASAESEDSSTPAEGVRDISTNVSKQDRDSHEEPISRGMDYEEPSGPPADDPWAVEDGDPFLDDE